MDVPTHLEASTDVDGTASIQSVLAAHQAQHGVRLHDAVLMQLDAGHAQGTAHGDQRELPVEADVVVEVKTALQEERDTSGEPRRVVLREPVTSSVGA